MTVIFIVQVASSPAAVASGKAPKADAPAAAKQRE
jgi:hypothetical protein